MMKSEYRRAFIMLRSSQQGYAGHVRLERRTMLGSMYFVVSAPDGAETLRAALAGSRNGTYYAAELGALRRDRRGQATLPYSFDPRDIGGRPLEAYQWVVVATQADGCALALVGNVDGAYPLDPEALREAVCAALGGGAPAADLPEPEAEPTAPEASDPPFIEFPGDAGTPSEPFPEAEPPVVDAARPEAASGAGVWADVAFPDVLPRAPEAVPDAEPAPIPAPAQAPEAAPEASASRARIFTAQRPSAPAEAGEAPGGASDEAPASAAADVAPEGLRALFRLRPAETMPFEDGYTYVGAPMPEGCGYDRCMIGLRPGEEGGASVRYALPGHYAAEPPAGLEGYAWMGGGGAGFWVLTVDFPGTSPAPENP